MAGRSRLSIAGPRRPALLLAAVVLVHLVALQWASRQYAQASMLKPMQQALYTRLLAPQEPPPVVAAAPAAPQRPARPSGRLQAASPAASPAATPAEEPRPAEQPQPEPPAPVAKPEPAASEPQVAAAPAPAPAASAAAQPASAPAVAAAPEPSASAAASAQAAASGPSAAVADSWPADTRLRYRLGGQFRGGDLNGNARVLWQREGTRYQVRVELEIPLLATLTMTSQGEVGTVLAPQVYEEARNGKPRGLRVGDNAITLANGTAVPRPPGVQDTASQFVDLSHRFATGSERLEVGRTVSFWMARPGGVDHWTYDIAGREVLSTRMGPVEAFHLKPRPIANPRGNITAEMWFAPTLQHLPVRIRVSMGEEATIDLMVEGIEQR
jgi:hypothetical protein